MDYSKCWLDYQPVDTIEKELLTYFQSCEGEIVESAVSEYKLAMENMAGKVPQTVTKEEAGVVFSVDSSIKEGKDGYIITKEESRYQITGESESGLLYGVFHFLRLIRTKQMNCLPVHNTPEMPLRMMNHWDNMDGSIERGYFTDCDPLNPMVAEWWKKAVAHVYDVIPNFGGFLVKADSEGRPGPFTYGRTHADGANMLGRALAPYGGILVWRCFVYNCGQDWRDKKTDRARAAYDNFIELDGKFDDNVILQIKNGPMDFQVREPVSPLFGGLKKTNMILEVEIAQEYTGQQIDLCYLLPMWREILDFDTYAAGEGSTVQKIVDGSVYGQHLCGMAAVINTGNDFNWTGNDLAAANTYGYGRMAMNPSEDSAVIAKEWAELTLPKSLSDGVVSMLMKSWSTYEKYTSPLGIGWMVTPHYHYGPDIDGYEYDRWGTYHRADRNGLGVDRTPNGTGYTTQYNEPWCTKYADKKQCPQELLLFFHYVRYDEVLASGKTLIQHIYDTHFEGVDEVEEMIVSWKAWKEQMAEDVYERVLSRMERQLSNAIEWRDRVNTYFYRKSGVKDALSRKIYE